jgi:hypothetical protein
MIQPKFQATIKDGEIIYTPQLKKYLSNFDGKQIDIIIKLHRKTRTDKQNAALHLYFTQLSEALNDAGFDMKKLLKQEIDIPWDTINAKEYLWLPIQKELLKKKSTTQLKSNEIDKVYEVLNRMIGERTGIFIPFPNIEELERQFNK